ncbi:MAG: hypothetical protein NTY09_00275 [bacterium]|nr:hypothetical protein [bacterium]
MSIPPDDPKNPNDAPPPDDDGDNKGDEIQFPDGMPPLRPGTKQRKIKASMSQSAHDVKFADMFGITLSQTHGIIKFGVFHPETGEFIIHTQIAMTPQGMVMLSQTLQKNIEKVRKMKPQGPQRMN